MFNHKYWNWDCGLLSVDYGSETTGYIWTINSGMNFFFWHNCKANTHIFLYVYLNFLPVLHIVNSLKITKTLMYSVLTKMRYKKQNWMQGQHNGKMADFFNWPKFRLTKSVFFRARAVNRGTHVYPRMSKGYLQPLVIFGVTFVHANLCVNI